MPYVVYDNRKQMYISRSTAVGFAYVPDINDAWVYKTKGGAVNAVGETDKSFESMGKYPPSKKLVVPSYLDIRQVDVTESGVKES